MTILNRSEDILSSLPKFKHLTSSLCDDVVDRLNHIYTVYILVIFAAIVGAEQYIGSPISCWIPYDLLTYNKDFSSYEDYVHNYCWVKNTYHVPIHEHADLPKSVDERKSQEITYYQWVPMILSTQALLFKLPSIIWRTLNGSSGMDIDKLCRYAETVQLANGQERKKAYANMVFVYDKWIKTLQFKVKCKERSAERRGRVLRILCYLVKDGEYCFLTVLYMFTKIVFLGNVLGQCFVLHAFVTSGNIEMSVSQWWRLLQRDTPMELTKDYLFPRVTMCDIHVRQLNNMFIYTVQCVLPINLFNERIFLFLWFWLGFVALLNIYGTIKWFVLLVFRRNSYRFVKKFLKISDTLVGKTDRQICRKFAEKYLRCDGCFLARMVAMNSSEMVVTKLLTKLFIRYRKREKRLQQRKHLKNDLHNSIIT